MKAVQEGKKIPAISLFNQEGEKISLKNYLGDQYLLLYFYPKAMTPGCTTQACDLRDSMEEFQKRNITIFGISPDKVEKLKKFIVKEELNFDLLSDEDHEVSLAFNSYGKKKLYGREYMGVMRNSFLVDLEGRLVATFEKVKPKEHCQQILDYFDENLAQ